MDETKSCPNCGEKIRALAIMCRFCQRGLSLKHFKRCPFCAEFIRIAATKCRYCLCDLDPPFGAKIPSRPTRPARPSKDEVNLPEKEAINKTSQSATVRSSGTSNKG